MADHHRLWGLYQFHAEHRQRQAMDDRHGTIHEETLAISADNLKKTLIEPGYISLADAGL